MTDVKEAIPQKWEKLDDTAKIAMRLSQAGLPSENRRYQVVNLHDRIAQLFGMAKIGGVDLDFNRRKLEQRVEQLCAKYKWANSAKAFKYLNDAWEHVKAANNPRMFLRQYQNEPDVKVFLDVYLDGFK
jgi:hypothetical protein